MPDELNDKSNSLLTQEAKKLLKVFSKGESEEVGEDSTKIHISNTIGHVAFWYEKLRSAVDYQEEHLLRKNTIRRIIARKFNFPIPSTETVSISLLRELARARLITQTEFSKDLIDKIDHLIHKYAILKDELFSEIISKKASKKSRILLDVISCSIEELLCSHAKDEALVGCMVSVMKRRIILDESDPIKDLHIYIAVHKLLLKSDEAIIRFQLFKKIYPNWFSFIKDDEVAKEYKKFCKINDDIDQYLFSENVDRVQKIIKRKTAPFYILGEIMRDSDKDEFNNIITKPNSLSNKVEEICQNHYDKTGTRLRTSVVQGIIYILTTKIILGILLELPYDLFTLGYIHYLPLSINLIFPPTFMFLITSFVKVPDWQNTAKINEEIKTIIYEENKKKDPAIYTLKPQINRSKTKTVFLSLLYALTFMSTIGLLFAFLIWLKFNLISSILFFFFLSVVSFFGFRIRQNARSLYVLEEKENFSSIMSDFIFMPFLRIGKWLAIKFQGINIFLIVLDFIIEAPFKSVMEVVEDWVTFMKEKKDELT
jgi:hypothetical protein